MMVARSTDLSHVTVVAGPPAGGKSTLVQRRAGPSDVVMDFDRLVWAMSAAPMHGTYSDQSPDVVRLVNAFRRDVLAQLPRIRRPVWWIDPAPVAGDRMAYAAAGCRVLVVSVPLEVSVERCAARPDSRDWRRLVGEWWAAFSVAECDEAIDGRAIE